MCIFVYGLDVWMIDLKIGLDSSLSEHYNLEEVVKERPHK